MFTSALHFSSYACTECASVTNEVHVPNLFIPFDNRILSCNEHGTIYAISSDFGDRMTTQSMGLMLLLSEHF